MPLDPAGEKIVQDWIRNNWPMSQCGVCGSRQWSTGELMVVPVIPGYVPGTPVNAQLGPGMPLAGFVPIICDRCAYTVFFPAERIGLAP